MLELGESGDEVDIIHNHMIIFNSAPFFHSVPMMVKTVKHQCLYEILWVLN